MLHLLFPLCYIATTNCKAMAILHNESGLLSRLAEWVRPQKRRCRCCRDCAVGTTSRLMQCVRFGESIQNSPGPPLVRHVRYSKRKPPLIDPTPLACLAKSVRQDRKSTRLNSSHTVISYAVFC